MGLLEFLAGSLVRGVWMAFIGWFLLTAVDLHAHLPSPDPDVTSELAAATEDAHAAAHMCLAVVTGSPKSYVGEFEADIDQVERHLAAAQKLINEALTASP